MPFLTAVNVKANQTFTLSRRPNCEVVSFVYSRQIQRLFLVSEKSLQEPLPKAIGLLDYQLISSISRGQFL